MYRSIWRLRIIRLRRIRIIIIISIKIRIKIRERGFIKCVVFEIAVEIEEWEMNIDSGWHLYNN